MGKSRRKKSRSQRLHYAVVLLLLAFATPPELSLDLGGLRLSPYRLVVIAMLIPCLQKLFLGSAGKVKLQDVLVLFHGLWAIIALVAYAGIGQGIESGGIYFAEAVGGYLIGRCLIRNADQFMSMARIMRQPRAAN